MKINLGKLARVLGRLAIAAPVVIAAARPVIGAFRKPEPAASLPATGTAPGTGRPAPDA